MTETAGANQGIAGASNRSQFQFIDQRRIRSDLMSGFPFVAKAKFRRNKNDPLRTDGHPLQSVAPAHHSAVASGKEMLVAIEFFAIDEVAAVFDDDEIVGRRLLARAFPNNSILQTVRKSIDPRRLRVLGEKSFSLDFVLLRFFD